MRAYGADHFDVTLRKCKVVDSTRARERRDWLGVSEAEFGDPHLAVLFGWIDEDPDDGVHVYMTPMNTAHAMAFNLGCE